MNDDAKDAARYRKLVALAGHWQDGSDVLVRLDQDDATRECLVVVDGAYFHGRTFDAAIDSIPEVTR